MLKKWFKNWTKFEIAFLFAGTIAACALTAIFKGTWTDLVYVLPYFWSALFLAKGKYFCYIIGIISTFFYAYVAYTNSYYGESIIALCCTLPVMILGLINWIRNLDNTKTVVVKEVSNKELAILLLSQAVMVFAYYFLLKAFNTENLYVSTFSVVISFIASYLIARRSSRGFIGFIINDITLIILWGIPVVQGNLTIIPVLLCPVLLLINDVYGAYNWRRIKQKQRRK